MGCILMRYTLERYPVYHTLSLYEMWLNLAAKPQFTDKTTTKYVPKSIKTTSSSEQKQYFMVPVFMDCCLSEKYSVRSWKQQKI